MSRDFLPRVFLWISVPPTPECPIRTVSNFFENLRRYSRLKVDHRCRWHRWQMKKIFNQKNFNNFVGTPLYSKLNIYINFCLQVHFEVSASWYCSQCLPPVLLTPAANLPPASLTPVANLPPVSTTLVKPVAKFAAGVVNTGGKFAAGVVDTGGNWWWLTPVVNLDLRISPQIFEKIGNGPNSILIHEKKPEAKNLVTLSL